MRYRLVIFDWDGTLMDSAARIVACMQAASRDAGWGELAPESIRNIIGLGLPEAIASLCPGIDAERAELLRSRYAWHFVEGNDTPMSFFPEVEGGLSGLHMRPGQRLAAASRQRAAVASTASSGRAAAVTGSTPAGPPTGTLLQAPPADARGAAGRTRGAAGGGCHGG